MSNILIADGDAKFIEKCVGVLGKDKHTYTLATRARQAIALVDSKRYDVIVLGGSFPDINYSSYDVALEIRSSHNNKHTAVICSDRAAGDNLRNEAQLRPYGRRVEVANDTTFKEQLTAWITK